MTCNQCGTVLRSHAEYCPQCGARMVVSIDDIIASSHSDAARRLGESVDGKLRTGILALIILFAVILGVVYLFDKPLVFAGAELPTIQPDASVLISVAGEAQSSPYKDPRPLPPLPPTAIRVLGHRKEPLRSALRAANGGGGHEYDATINKGLGFLQKLQDRDGGWPVSLFPSSQGQGDTGDFKWGRVGVSSLALLSFLGDGNTWVPELNGSRSMHAECVRRGVAFLLANQDAKTGRFGGRDHHFMYNHAMATLALAEAAALSGDVELRDHVAKALPLLISAQTKKRRLGLLRCRQFRHRRHLRQRLGRSSAGHRA